MTQVIKMNISNLREQDHEIKQDGANDGSSKSLNYEPSLTTSSWSRLKDPRTVRVSRAFGGKDRHSKVCTVRGLRDRRVRLSVPTAIQLYDLQDRLGLNQPSKAVDWLLDAAKNEIDELPPLQIPPQNLGQNVESCNPNSSNLPGLLNNVVPNSSFLKWDPSNLSLHDDTVLLYPTSHNHNSIEFAPKQLNFQMVSSSSSSKFTPPQYTINQGMRPFHLSMNPKFFSSEDDGQHGLNK